MYDKYGWNARNFTKVLNGVSSTFSVNLSDNGAIIYGEMLKAGDTISITSQKVDNDKGMYLICVTMGVPE